MNTHKRRQSIYSMLAIFTALMVAAQVFVTPAAQASAVGSEATRVATATAAGAKATVPAKKIRLTKKQIKSLAKARAQVLAVAKTQPNFVGRRVAAQGTVLRLYGVSKPSAEMKKAMKTANSHAKLKVIWKATAKYTKAELLTASRIVRTDHRVSKVYIRPDKGGYLEVAPKARYKFDLIKVEEFLSQTLHIGVPSVIKSSDSHDARPAPVKS